jgi:hypothetical protein
VNKDFQIINFKKISKALFLQKSLVLKNKYYFEITENKFVFGLNPVLLKKAILEHINETYISRLPTFSPLF